MQTFILQLKRFFASVITLDTYVLVALLLVRGILTIMHLDFFMKEPLVEGRGSFFHKYLLLQLSNGSKRGDSYSKVLSIFVYDMNRKPITGMVSGKMRGNPTTHVNGKLEGETLQAAVSIRILPRNC